MTTVTGSRLALSASPLGWLRTHDAGLWALRRATRTAIVMPALFALGAELAHNSLIASFAAFGSFALLLLVDFGGTMRERLEATVSLAVAGAGLISIGTLASQTAWLAAAVMAVVAFVVLFAGVISSVLASASTSLLLAFVLSVTTIGPVSSLPDRLAGWGLASVAALAAVAVLWPAPPRDVIRGPVAACCRVLAERLRAYAPGEAGALGREDVSGCASQSVSAMRAAFYAGPSRPAGLGTAGRTVIRLVDKLGWLSTVLDRAPAGSSGQPVAPEVLAVRLAAADALECSAAMLSAAHPEPYGLQDADDMLRRRLCDMERAATGALPLRPDVLGAAGARVQRKLGHALEPAFHAQEMAFAVSAITANVTLTVQAEARGWLQRVLGYQPAGVRNPFAAARDRVLAHLERHSVWLHNSLRGAAGLALAVLLADLSHAQHSFWVVLGTLSVLRSNALSTGQNVARGLLGTTAGIVIGGVIVTVTGTGTTVLWILLPFGIVLAGLAPTAISFAAGQAGFTLTLVILSNIVQPVGYRVGLVRIEDVGLGVTVSLLVGVLFWPRGASSVLGRALAEAYEASALYLREAVLYGIGRGDATASPKPLISLAAAGAAFYRLDDAFREYLAERGSKQLHLGEVTTLVSGVIAPRLVGQAVLDLWQRDDGAAGGDRTAAGAELSIAADQVLAWYRSFGAALTGSSPVPQPQDPDAGGRLAGAVQRDLGGQVAMSNPTAVRMIWTGEHLDTLRRLQESLVGPARAIS